MYAAHAGTLSPTGDQTFLQRLNAQGHERALQGFTVIVLAHWAEHLLQAFQIYGLGWPVPQARGVLGYFFPYLVTSEMLHYGYAVVMLAGLWILRPGFTGDSDRKWWTVALSIQFFHHIEHFLLAGAVPARPEPVRQAGADEHRAAVGPARRAASLLQHDRLHPDDDRDVLPHVPTAGRGQAAAMHVRVAPRAQRQRVSGSHHSCLQPGRRLCGTGCGVDFHWHSEGDSGDAISVTWTLDPSPPVVGTPVVARMTLRDRDSEARDRRATATRGRDVPSRHGAGRRRRG